MDIFIVTHAISSDPKNQAHISELHSLNVQSSDSTIQGYGHFHCFSIQIENFCTSPMACNLITLPAIGNFVSNW